MEDRLLWKQREKVVKVIVEELKNIEEKIQMYENLIYNLDEDVYLERLSFLKEEKEFLQMIVKMYYDREV